MLDKELRSFASDVWHVKFTMLNIQKKVERKVDLFPFSDGGDCQEN